MRRHSVFSRCIVQSQPPDLPVKQVVLYKHGVGFFERSGTPGTGRIGAPRFQCVRHERRAEIADPRRKAAAAKSPACATIPWTRSATSWPTSPSSLRAANPLAAMFDQLKGARVELKLGSDTVAGAIVSGRVVAATDKQAGARTPHPAARFRRDAHRRPGRRQPASASPTPNCKRSSRITWRRSPPRGPRTSAACTSIPPTPRARGGGQLHDSGGGVEVELPADFRRQAAQPCWRVGPSSTTPPARIGRRCSFRWFRAARFRSSASCTRRVTLSDPPQICPKRWRWRQWWIRARWTRRRRKPACPSAAGNSHASRIFQSCRSRHHHRRQPKAGCLAVPESWRNPRG